MLGCTKGKDRLPFRCLSNNDSRRAIRSTEAAIIPLRVISPYVFVDKCVEAFSALGESFHFLYIGTARALVCIKVDCSVCELNSDKFAPAFIGLYSGIAVFVAYHGAHTSLAYRNSMVLTAKSNAVIAAGN